MHVHVPMYACMCYYFFRIVELFLMEDESCVHLKGFHKETPLHSAVYGGHIDTIKLLLGYRADVKAR